MLNQPFRTLCEEDGACIISFLGMETPHKECSDTQEVTVCALQARQAVDEDCDLFDVQIIPPTPCHSVLPHMVLVSLAMSETCFVLRVNHWLKE